MGCIKYPEIYNNMVHLYSIPTVDTKELIINKYNIIPEISHEILDMFTRDTYLDIINVPYTDNDKCLFYYMDNEHIFYAYNTNMLEKDIINKYKYKYNWGCLSMFSNTKQCLGCGDNSVKILLLFSHLMEKVGWDC